MINKLDNREMDTVTNALRVAMFAFREDAKVFEQLSDQGGNAFVTKDAAYNLYKQFRSQEEDCSKLLDKLGA